MATVKMVLNIETIRDGGSLAAKFLDDDGAKWILFLKIDVARGPRSEKKVFEEIVLIDADPTKRPKDTENRIWSELAGPALALSWAEAQALVEQIAERATNLNPWQAQSLVNLQTAVQNRDCA
jgi:hypothetical protein